MCLTIILAAGLKLNHKTKLPSVLDNVNGKPWLFYHIKQALTIKSTHILVVVGKYRNIIDISENPNKKYQYGLVWNSTKPTYINHKQI